MGQKVNPVGMRVGVIRDWQSRWYADDKDFGTTLLEDVKIREFIENYYKKLSEAAADKRKADPQISRIEIERSKNLDARLVARWIADQLEGRRSFRATQKKAIQNTMRAGAKGIKTAVSGRLGGADMARTEGYSEGVVPLHTLRSDIDYAWEEAATQYGRLGVKVWICRGEVLPGEMVKEPEAPKERPRRNNRRRKNFNKNNRQGGTAKAGKAEQTAAPSEGGNE